MKTIVLVEDEKDLNSLIKAYLEKAGYRVICYLNGEEAILNSLSKEYIDEYDEKYMNYNQMGLWSKGHIISWSKIE